MDKFLLCDTCVIIDFINDHDLLLANLRDNRFTLFINSIIEMELLQGAHDRPELRKVQKKLKNFRRLEINQDLLNIATNLVSKYTLSHRINPADAVIAATAMVFALPLFTYNAKDFKYLPGIRLWDPVTFRPAQGEDEPLSYNSS